jgi:hypothetical protein
MMSCAECATCGTVWVLGQFSRLWRAASWRDWAYWRVKIGILSATIVSCCVNCHDGVAWLDWQKIRDAHERRPGAPVCKLSREYADVRYPWPARTYELVKGGEAIKCLCCGMTSHYYLDVKERWCGFCKDRHRG